MIMESKLGCSKNLHIYYVLFHPAYILSRLPDLQLVESTRNVEEADVQTEIRYINLLAHVITILSYPIVESLKRVKMSDSITAI